MKFSYKINFVITRTIVIYHAGASKYDERRAEVGKSGKKWKPTLVDLIKFLPAMWSFYNILVEVVNKLGS
ncbi:hypothetical protein [Thiothrix lacustris]|uniref:hypothetical protein n=1 Tax=Thiothrix lacustris TaxID=525917 RepID=UPI0027E4260B|nr:hypothetical protein [Thiothrix lacustris]WMP17013.1 hypothetical protein RCS87_16775 [Thiothrix lacustris]